MNMLIFVLIDLKRRIKDDTVFVMKANTHILNVHRKRNLLVYHKCSIQDSGSLNELISLQSQTELRLQDKLGKRNFHENENN